MILSNVDIGKVWNRLVEPFDEKRVTASGYDLSALDLYMVDPKESVLASTSEVVNLPDFICGILHLRSTFVRMGLIGSFGLVDPGFSGTLTVRVYNTNDHVVPIKKGERFIQLAFARLETPTTKPYQGKYQGSKGVVEAKKD